MNDNKKELIPYPVGISDLDAITVQVAALQVGFRALLLAHPQPDAVRTSFDQLAGQLLASPFFLDDPRRATLLRSMTEILFRPQIHLEP